MDEHNCIMVADDDKSILKLLNRLLKEVGYHVITAENGKAALTLLEKYTPDLILLDITMPELDGFQVLRSIRQRFNIPVIMLTGQHEIRIINQALALGADDYITKPFSSRELLARVKAKLRRATKKQ